MGNVTRLPKPRYVIGNTYGTIEIPYVDEWQVDGIKRIEALIIWCYRINDDGSLVLRSRVPIDRKHLMICTNDRWRELDATTLRASQFNGVFDQLLSLTEWQIRASKELRAVRMLGSVIEPTSPEYGQLATDGNLRS